MIDLAFLLLRIALAVSLYGFLGWALWTIAQDVQIQSALLQARRPSDLLLNSEDGLLNLRFSKAEVILGRDDCCDGVLTDPTVSGHHARLAFHHQQWWLEDLGSTNGTFLNDDPVSSPVVIITGDALRCGQMRLDVVISTQEN